MTWKTSLFIVLSLVFFSCKEKSAEVLDSNKSSSSDEIQYSSGLSHIIEADELQKILEEPNIKVIHFGKEQEYRSGHIKGSVNIWRSDIEDASYPYKGMMCSKNQLEELFSQKGINSSDTIIVYDNVASCDAARLWWVLENYGFKNLKILNGGLTAWNEAGWVLTTEPTIYEATEFKLPDIAPMSLYVDKEQMLGFVNGSNPPLILDTRTTNEYTGVQQKSGAKTAGRIPGSLLMDWADCVNYSGDKKFKGIEELEKIYSKIIPEKDQAVVAYCHSGVRSAHTTFVLTQLLGYTNVKNYDGSWTEWSNFENYPKEKDSITTILQ